MRTRLVICILLAAVAALASSTVALGAFGDGDASGQRGAPVTNPWFPLAPGTTWVYAGVKDGHAVRDVVTVSRRKALIAGVPCVVVTDRLYRSDGPLLERTTDYYTQDAAGRVWYYGERTATLDGNGHVTSTEGSWRAGTAGAAPGVYMPAAPRLGRSFRQEFLKGHAEDHFRITALVGGSPAAAGNLLVTKEWTPLEPGVLDRKLYVRGVGEVLEESTRGPAERLELVSMRRSL